MARAKAELHLLVQEMIAWHKMLRLRESDAQREWRVNRREAHRGMMMSAGLANKQSPQRDGSIPTSPTNSLHPLDSHRRSLKRKKLKITREDSYEFAHAIDDLSGIENDSEVLQRVQDGFVNALPPEEM